jgi:hypothetical protein
MPTPADRSAPRNPPRDSMGTIGEQGDANVKIEHTFYHPYVFKK